jgi:hypothetical protein
MRTSCAETWHEALAFPIKNSSLCGLYVVSRLEGQSRDREDL